MDKDQNQTQPDEIENPTQENQEKKGFLRFFQSKTDGPALVINVHTWATPIAGVVMLVVGLLLGYFGRPLISGQNESSVASVPQSASDSSSSSAAQGDLMNFLVDQTKHFKGDPDATVTLIEFSDFK